MFLSARKRHSCQGNWTGLTRGLSSKGTGAVLQSTRRSPRLRPLPTSLAQTHLNT
jgi:hypothetical protein